MKRMGMGFRRSRHMNSKLMPHLVIASLLVVSLGIFLFLKGRRDGTTK